MQNNSIFLNSNQNIPEIRCPYCFSYISLELNNNNLITYCENCGKNEILMDDFISIINKNNIKSCNSCCKNIEIKDMLYSHNNKSFLCKKCFVELKEKNEIIEDEYINVNEIGRKCLKHKGAINNFFCLKCNVHICNECKKEHKSHEIKNIKEEAKYQKKIDEMTDILNKEEKYLEEEKILYEKLLTNMSKKFEKSIKNKTDILKLKQIIFDSFVTNNQSFTSYQNISIINDEKKIGDFDIDLDNIDKIINNISLNNDNNNISEEENKSNNKNIRNSSYSVIKLSKKKIYSNPTGLEDNKPNLYPTINSNNKLDDKSKKIYTLDKSVFGLVSPEKINYIKNRKIEYKNSINMINQEILNKSFDFNNYNFNNNKENNSKENFHILNKLSNSIINILYLGDNKMLATIFAQENNLILIEIKKEKTINKEQSISLEILMNYNIHTKPINHIEMGEDGSILSCSDNELIKFKLENGVIKILFVDNISSESKSFITCFSLFSENILVLASPYTMNYYKKINQDKYSKIFLPKIDGFKYNYMEKLTDNHIILVGQKIANVNHNIAYLIFVEVDKNTIKKGFEKEVNVKENEKICIKKIFENYVIISLPREGFIIFDYLKNKILYKYTCEYIIAMKIEIFNKNFIYCYTVETKDNEGKIVEEMNLKKYLIQKIIKRKKFDFSVEEKSKISLCPKNQINDIILINLNKDNLINNCSENDKKLVLLGDNNGNILYNYC